MPIHQTQMLHLPDMPNDIGTKWQSIRPRCQVFPQADKGVNGTARQHIYQEESIFNAKELIKNLLTKMSDKAKLVMKTLVTVCMALLRQTTTRRKNTLHHFFSLVRSEYIRTTRALPAIPKKKIKTQREMNVALIGRRFSNAIEFVVDVDVVIEVLSKFPVNNELLIELSVL